MCDWACERTVQRPQQQPPPQPQLANIFGDGQSANQFNLGPFTAFTNFQQRPVVQQQQPLQQSPAGTQNLRSPASTSNLGFEAVRNTVVHDSSSQSSSFFSFQRPEFSNQRPQPTRFPEAQRPSPVSAQPSFFSGFPSIGTFVDTRGGQRAQRDLHAKEAESAAVNRNKPQNFKFPDPEFGGFVPMHRGHNRRY